MKSFYQNWKLDIELPMAIHHGDDLTFYAHYHSEIEFIYVESGSILVGVNEEKRLLEQGDMVICCSNDIHYFESKELSSKVIILIFKPEMISLSMSWPNDFRFTSPFITGKRPEFKHIRGLLYDIMEEKNNGKPGYQMFIKASLLELCGTLQRNLPSERISRSSSNKLESKRARIQQILSFIEENYQEDLSVEMMATQFQMDPSYFCRTFKSAVGVNFKTYLNTIRVLTAERLLISSDASITDIALECGFNSIRTFNRVYKEFKGYVPSSTRQGAL
ncbi:AraC family transcriptional regulator [Paenibacillus fonticola]|uniref:AraC family transcriptional regulator n=1 Tax=Paenibacillus fonticola TaxID=379896 RepID=UPI00036D9168|nr:AraC family transcriptional regulator [Paenibacillus fonticola]